MRLVLAVLVASAAMLAAFGWLALKQSSKPQSTTGQRPASQTSPTLPATAELERNFTSTAPAEDAGGGGHFANEATQRSASLPSPDPSLKGRVVAADAARTPASSPTNVPVDPTDVATLRLLERARAALAEDPYHPAALHDELAALARMGRWEEALVPLCRLIELDPNDLDLQFDRAGMLLRLRRYVEAIATLNALVGRRPDDAKAWFNLAVAHQSLGHLSDARIAWDRTIELSPSPTAHTQRGIVLMDLREWAAAADDFQAVLDAQPDALDAILNLALALERLGRRDEARAKLIESLEQHPRWLPVINRLAELAAGADQLEPTEARRAELAEWCRRSLEIDPNQPEILALLETTRHSP